MMNKTMTFGNRNNRVFIWQKSGEKIVPTDLQTDDKIEVEGKENRRIS